MPAAHAYAERIRARLPRTLQEERAAAGLSRDAPEKKCGVSREMIGCIESGYSIPTLHLGVRLAHCMGMTLATFVAKLEDGAETRSEGEASVVAGRSVSRSPCLLV